MVQFTHGKNSLTANENTFEPRILSMHTISNDFFIDRAMERGSDLSREKIKKITVLLTDTIATLSAQGRTMKTTLGDGLKNDRKTEKTNDGIFNQERLGEYIMQSDSFSKNAHCEFSAEKAQPSQPEPIVMDKEYDLNDVLPEDLFPYDLMVIQGVNLEYNISDPEQGVFLVAVGGLAMRCDAVFHAASTYVLLLIPNIPAGYYHLELRNKFTQNGMESKTLKIARYGEVLALKENPEE